MLVLVRLTLLRMHAGNSYDYTCMYIHTGNIYNRTVIFIMVVVILILLVYSYQDRQLYCDMHTGNGCTDNLN